MPSILFVCTGNEYRSPIAAACFHKLLKMQHSDQGWLISSAGTWTIPNRPVAWEAKQSAILLGLDLRDQRTQVVTNSLLENYDLVLGMEKGHKEAIGIEFPFMRERIYLLSEMVEGIPFDIPDPHFSLENADRILSEMCDLIQQGFPKIKQLAEELSRSRP